MAEKEKIRPKQDQNRPGKESKMRPEPKYEPKGKGSDKLKNKIALITVADSGIGASIVNTTSITAYRGSDHLIDYASSKGAILAFTRNLSQSLVKKGIRVNAVSPDPIWTPLIASTFDKEQVAKFGSDTPMGRAGEPNEVAPCFLFFASEDSSYITGQTLHPNGDLFSTDINL